MNELLMGFVDEAEKHSWEKWSESTSRQDVTYQKFAELIITECCKMVNDRHQSPNNPHDCLTVLEIKERFGVDKIGTPTTNT